MKRIVALTLAGLCCAAPALANENMTEAQKTEKVNAIADYYLKQVDTNGDGKVTKAECEAYGDKMFKASDTNNDGSLSLDEMRTHQRMEMDKMHSEMDKSTKKPAM